jgi:hypothetical protein
MRNVFNTFVVKTFFYLINFLPLENVPLFFALVVTLSYDAAVIAGSLSEFRWNDFLSTSDAFLT